MTWVVWHGIRCCVMSWAWHGVFFFFFLYAIIHRDLQLVVHIDVEECWGACGVHGVEHSCSALMSLALPLVFSAGKTVPCITEPCCTLNTSEKFVVTSPRAETNNNLYAGEFSRKLPKRIVCFYSFLEFLGSKLLPAV